MQITVKSIKVLKEGTNQYGEWKLVQVFTAEDIRYTTLAKEADTITAGSIINITDMDKDEQGRESFKKFNIIEKGAGPTPAPGPTKANSDDSPEKRKSIEDQTRAERITELWIAGKLEPDDSLKTKLRAWLEKLGSPEPAKKATEPAKGKAPPATPKEGENWPPLKNRGELFTRAQRFGISTRDVCETVEVGKPEDIIDLDEAWTATAKRFASAIKAASEVTK